MNDSPVNRWREEIISLCMAQIKLHLITLCSFWAPQHKRAVNTLERAQCRITGEVTSADTEKSGFV